MKKFSLYIMAAFYMGGGLYHFVNPGFYLKLIPDFMPAHESFVYLSGVIEIILGVLLVPSNTRHLSAWLIIAMLVIFFFVIHIPVTINFYKTDDPKLLLSILRLPLQFLLIWWAWMYKQKQHLI